MIYKALFATIGFYVLWTGFWVFTDVDNSVGNALTATPLWTASIGGVSVASVFSNLMGQMAAGFVLCLIFLILYLFAAAHSREEDTGMLY